MHLVLRTMASEMMKYKQNRGKLPSQCPRRSRHLFALGVTVWLVAILIVAVTMFGCSPKTKYHVLSFFFDGVPPPPGMPGYGEPEVIIGPDGTELDPKDPRTIEFLATDRIRRKDIGEAGPAP